MCSETDWSASAIDICLVMVRAAGVAQGGSQAGARCGREST
jgi:hypothetical protein